MFRRGFVCILSISLAASALFAQVTTADIVGRVTDSSSAILPNAKVTIENLDTHDIRTATSGDNGDYSFTLLPIGRYTVHVEAANFKGFNVPTLTLASGDRARVDAQLSVGQVSESVSVEAQAPALQSDSSTTDEVVTTRAVEDLPLNGRNFSTLAQLAPGTNAGAANALSSGTRPDDRRPGVTVSVGAQGSQVNNYMVDGMDNNDRAIGTAIVRPSIDALAEIHVQTNLYTAEVGRTAGGVVNLLSKSGTNAIHGTAYEFFRNDKMDARNFFALTKPEFRQNQYGGSAGGPVRKDKTFFFGDFEEFTQVQGQTFTANVPTDAVKSGNFGGIAKVYDPNSTVCTAVGVCSRTEFLNDQIPLTRLNPLAQKYLQLYPEQNVPNTISTGLFTSSFPKTQKYGTLDARVDQRFSEKDYFYARYSYNDTTTFIPGNLPAQTVAGIGLVSPTGSTAGIVGPALQRAQGIQLNHVHIIRPNLLLELKGGWVRYASQTFPVDYGKNVSQQFGIANANHSQISSGLSLVVPAGYESLGDPAFSPILQFDNTFQYSANLTWNRGSHSIKTGVTLIRRQFTIAQSQTPRGQWNFDANASNNGAGAGGNAIASLLLGVPAQVNTLDAFIFPGYRTWEPSAFFQDDWRISSTLTLNLGLRYDIFTPFTEEHDRISNLNLTTGKVDIAGQNGVSSTAGVKTDYKNFAPRIGFAWSLPQKMVLRGGFGVSYIPGQYMSQSYLKNPPFVAQFSFTNDTYDPVCVTAFCAGANPYTNISNGFPPFTPISASNPSGNIIATNYNLPPTYIEQFNIQLQKDIRGTVIGVGYVGALNRGNAQFANINQPDPGAGTIQSRRPYFGIFPNVQNITYVDDDGTLNYHSLQSTFVHRYGKGLVLNGNYTWSHALQSAAPGQVESNWKLEYGNSPLDIRHRLVLAANYELPFGKSFKGIARQVIADWQANAIFVFNTGQPFSVTNNTARANTGAADRPNRIASGALANPTLAEFFDVTAFVAQPLNTAGNSGPFILYGPNQKHFDASLFKNFGITERFKLQFRAEAYNISNTPTFANPNGALGNANFGKITSTVVGTTPRQIQLAVKLLF
jgi:outer membrane receptor protein involved in Fe transport